MTTDFWRGLTVGVAVAIAAYFLFSAISYAAMVSVYFDQCVADVQGRKRP
jgi:hypothetical protein